MKLEELLRKRYGYTAFRPGQKEVIEEVLKGRDVLAMLPTGMGKSMCYQLPAYEFAGSVVIISPLLSLMQDQVSQLKKMGEKSVIAINSFLKPEEKPHIWRTLSSYKFIFISPEMLLQPFVLKQLQSLRISLLVADEAHCISQWGFDFRPDYLRIAEVLPALGHPQILALTATATKKVEDEISQYLQLRDPFIYEHPMDRKNIAYDIQRFESAAEKIEWLLAFTVKHEGPGIIYCGTRNKAEQLSLLLNDHGLSAAYYHGGMEHQDRIFIQQQFQNGEIMYVCSTNAFGMGVHVPNVRHVIHFQLPTSIEGYVQEVGRAGRDGLPALATLLYAPGDEGMMISLLADDLPTRHEIEAVASAGGSRHLVDEGIVRETAYRVISYWLGKLDKEQIVSLMHDLHAEKMRQAEKMRFLLSGQMCIREYVLSCFNQSLDERPANCCCYCGLDYSIYPSSSAAGKQEKMAGWEERLNLLLP